MSALPTSFEDLMMAQQAIYDLSNELFAYELFFRNNDESMADFLNGDNATSQVLVNLCIGITEFEVQMGVPFFINVTRHLLVSDAFFPIDPKRVYIEVLENQEITPELIFAVERWHKEGYRFALDNYNFDKNYDALLPYTSIIKIDVLNTSLDKHKRQIARLIDQNYILLASKVENQNSYKMCKEFGFVLFQGYFLKHPNIIKGKRIPSKMNDALDLAKKLQNDDISITEVSDLIKKNPSLSYQLLRLLNSPICGIQRQVTDLTEAVIYLGLEQIKKWAILITISTCSKKMSEVFRLVLVRAKCCENLSLRQDLSSSDSSFMTGIMSGIHLILNIEQDIIFKQISIDKKIIMAIYNMDGSLGNILKDVLSYEDFDLDYIVSLPPSRRTDLSESYAEASIWANEIIIYM